MATCKADCLHHPVCRLPFNTSETQVEFADVCHHFKNKADFVEVKHRYWEPVYNTFRCSECHQPAMITRFHEPACTTYCQKCGAKMDGERRCENDS